MCLWSMDLKTPQQRRRNCFASFLATLSLRTDVASKRLQKCCRANLNHVILKITRVFSYHFILEIPEVIIRVAIFDVFLRQKALRFSSIKCFITSRYQWCHLNTFNFTTTSFISVYCFKTYCFLNNLVGVCVWPMVQQIVSRSISPVFLSCLLRKGKGRIWKCERQGAFGVYWDDNQGPQFSSPHTPPLPSCQLTRLLIGQPHACIE